MFGMKGNRDGLSAGFLEKRESGSALNTSGGSGVPQGFEINCIHITPRKLGLCPSSGMQGSLTVGLGHGWKVSALPWWIYIDREWSKVVVRMSTANYTIILPGFPNGVVHNRQSGGLRVDVIHITPERLGLPP
jgi:hypothetical protein